MDLLNQWIMIGSLGALGSLLLIRHVAVRAIIRDHTRRRRLGNHLGVFIGVSSATLTGSLLGWGMQQVQAPLVVQLGALATLLLVGVLVLDFVGDDERRRSPR